MDTGSSWSHSLRVSPGENGLLGRGAKRVCLESKTPVSIRMSPTWQYTKMVLGKKARERRVILFSLTKPIFLRNHTPKFNKAWPTVNTKLMLYHNNNIKEVIY